MFCIANYVFWFAAALDIIQMLDQVNMKLVSQLMTFQEFSKKYLNVSMEPLF